MHLSIQAAEAMAGYWEAACCMCLENYFCRGLRGSRDVDFIAVDVDLSFLICFPDHLDDLSLGNSNDLVPDYFAILDL